VDDFADVLGPGRYRPLGTRTAEEIATEKLLSGDEDRGLFSRMLLRDPQEGINKIREDRGLASLDVGSTDKTTNMQDQGTSDYNIDNIGAPTRQQEFTGDPDSSAYNVTTPKPDADADRQALLAQFDNLSKEYTMPEDLKKGFEKIRTGVKTEVDEAQRDIEESQVAAKEELFTPLIGLGQAIATGKSTISGALDEAYKQFLQEQQFPSEALKEYQSYVQSFPNIPTQVTRTPPPAQPSLAQTLLGGLGTAVGTYGAFGGFSPAGS